MQFQEKVQQFFLEKIKETESERKVSKLVWEKLNHNPGKLTIKDINHLMICVNVDKVVIDKTEIFTI